MKKNPNSQREQEKWNELGTHGTRNKVTVNDGREQT